MYRLIVLNIMTTIEKLKAIKNRYEAGDEVQAGVTIETIGRKYVTCISCISICGSVHTVKYTIDDFYDWLIAE